MSTLPGTNHELLCVQACPPTNDPVKVKVVGLALAAIGIFDCVYITETLPSGRVQSWIFKSLTRIVWQTVDGLASIAALRSLYFCAPLR